MAQDVNEGSYRISGRYGEGFFIDPSGTRPPLKLVEATAITFTKAMGVEDVPLSGNRTGTKDSGEEPGTGQMTLQKIDQFLNNIVYAAFNQNLPARRVARDSGQRIPRTFTLQVWEDDPEALGVLGHQLDGVRLSDYAGGYDFSQTITPEEHAFRYERLTQISSFERIGNNIDAATGLPAVRYTARIGTPPR